MTDLLTPDVVRDWKEAFELVGSGLVKSVTIPGIAVGDIARLCRDYLTLWDRSKELEGRLTSKHYDWPTPKNMQNPMGGRGK